MWENDFIEPSIYLMIIHFTVMLSPGPLLCLVLDAGKQQSTYLKYTTVLGIVCATFTNVALTLLGLMSLITIFPYLQKLITVLGAAYLLYLAFVKLYDVFSRETNDLHNIIEKKDRVGFRYGYFMNLLNPKIAVFYTSIFSQVVSEGFSFYIEYIFGLQMILQSLIYWSTIMILANGRYIQNLLISQEKKVDFILGIVLLLFAFSMFSGLI